MNQQTRLGRHLGLAGGMARALGRGREAGYDAAQVFPGNPTGWRHVPLAPELAAAIRAEATRRDVAPLVIHAPYIINVATPDEDLAAKSLRGVANALDRAGEIGARYVVVHAGSHKGTGEQAGIERVARLTDTVLADAPDGVELLIENSVGAGHILGGSIEAMGRLLAALPREVGCCVDTAHLWGGGSDISAPQQVERVLDELDRAVGLWRLRVLHLNDSAVALDSHRDVHAHLGEGQIGLAGLAAWAAHPALRALPVIVETPEEEDAGRETARCTIARLLARGDAEGAATALEGLRAAAATADDTAKGSRHLSDDGDDGSSVRLPAVAEAHQQSSQSEAEHA